MKGLIPGRFRSGMIRLLPALLFWLRPASGIRAASSDPVPVTSQWEMIGNLLYVIVVLIAIIALIVLLIRFLSRNSRIFTSGRGIRLLGGIPLGQNKSLQIVEIAGRIYVLGVGDNVQLIDVIADEKEAERIRRMIDARGASAGSGKPGLPAWLGRRKPLSGEQEETGAGTFQEIFYEKMSRVSESKKKQLEDWMGHADGTEGRKPYEDEA